MSDDSFIREVDEELRSERVQEFWSRYGKILITAVAVLILSIAAYQYWDYSTSTAAAKAGDDFLAAIELDQQGKQDEALTALKTLEGEGSAAYKTMAQLSTASILVKEGKVADAVKIYDGVAADNEAEENFRAIARIKAGMLLVDSGTVAEVETRVTPLSAPGAPYRASALEALALAYYKAGDLEKSFKQYEVLSQDSTTPSSMRQRVSTMLAVIASSGGPVLEK